jgi:uncharacterized membrane protein YagU involved in acid resistance
MYRIIVGSLGGVGATATMSGVMLAGKAAGILRTPPPKEITGRAGQRAGVPPQQVPKDVFDVSWMAAHLGFGMGCGVLFTLTRSLWPKSDLQAGLLFGTLVWAVSYLGVMPAAGLYPWPSEDSNSRTAVMIAAHTVFGVTLANAESRLDGPR